MQNKSENTAFDRRLGDRRDKRRGLINKILATISSLLVVALISITMLFFVCAESIQNLNASKTYVQELNSNIQRWISTQISSTKETDRKDRIDSIFPLLAAQLETYDIWDYPEIAEDIHEQVENLHMQWYKIQDEAALSRTQDWNDQHLLELGLASFVSCSDLNELIESIFIKRTEELNSLQNMAVVVMFVFLGIATVQFFDSVAERKKRQALQEIAYVDVATGVFNRSRCELLLAEELQEHKENHLILFDLNDLKMVNDTLGHIYGDRLIADFAQSLRDTSEAMNENVFIGRYGGDEFIVYFPSRSPKVPRDFLIALEERIEAINLKTEYYQVSYACGCVASKDHPNAGTVSALLQQADAKMYEDKLKIKQDRKKNQQTSETAT